MLSDRIDLYRIHVSVPDWSRFRRASCRERANSSSRGTRYKALLLSRVSPTYLGARSEKSDVSSQRRFAENVKGTRARARKFHTRMWHTSGSSLSSSKMENAFADRSRRFSRGDRQKTFMIWELKKRRRNKARGSRTIYSQFSKFLQILLTNKSDMWWIKNTLIQAEMSSD